MFQILLNLKQLIKKIIRKELFIGIISLILLCKAPTTSKQILEKYLKESLTTDQYILFLNAIINILSGIFCFLIWYSQTAVETTLVTKGLNKNIKLIPKQPTHMYIDINFKRIPKMMEGLFSDLYLEIATPDWIEITLKEAKREKKNQVRLSFSEFFQQDIRLPLTLMKGNMKRNKIGSLKIKVVFGEKTFLNAIKALILTFFFNYLSINEEIEAIAEEE